MCVTRNIVYVGESTGCFVLMDLLSESAGYSDFTEGDLHWSILLANQRSFILIAFQSCSKRCFCIGELTGESRWNTVLVNRLSESAGCFVSVKVLGVYCFGEYAVRVSGVFCDSEISGCVSGVLCIYRVLLL